MKNLNKDYLEHNIFNQLVKHSEFYQDLSFSIMKFISSGTSSLVNIDTYFYSSIQGTLESIKLILSEGRINDSYSLLRKYYDSTIINIYTNLFLQDNFRVDNLIVTQIENWRKGTNTIPKYRVISQYIKESPKLKTITELLQKDDTYRNIRNRCNDHAHYNFYSNLLLNDNQIFNTNRLSSLDVFLDDLDAIFIQHIAYIFYLNDHYMMSTYYVESLEAGLKPEEGSEYYVEGFVQNIFDQTVKIKRPDIAKVILENTSMKLL